MLDYIIQYGPAIIAVLGEIAVVASIFSKVASYFKKTEEAIDKFNQSAEYVELKYQMKEVLKENNELKVALKQLLAKISHMKVVENENEQNNKKQ